MDCRFPRLSREIIFAQQKIRICRKWSSVQGMVKIPTYSTIRWILDRFPSLRVHLIPQTNRTYSTIPWIFKFPRNGQITRKWSDDKEAVSEPGNGQMIRKWSTISKWSNDSKLPRNCQICTKWSTVVAGIMVSGPPPAILPEIRSNHTALSQPQLRRRWPRYTQQVAAEFRQRARARDDLIAMGQVGARYEGWGGTEGGTATGAGTGTREKRDGRRGLS